MAADTSVDIIVNQKASLEVTFNVKTANGTVLNLTNYTAAAPNPNADSKSEKCTICL